MEDREKYLREIQQIAHEEALKLREAGFTVEYEMLQGWITVWRIAETLKDKNLADHLERWEIWRENNLNSKFAQILTLIGATSPPTFVGTLTKSETDKIFAEMQKCLG